MKLRNYRNKDDFNKLLNLIVEFEYDKQISFEKIKISRDKIYSTNKKNLTEFLNDKTYKYFICEDENKMIGYAFASFDKTYNEGYINEVYIIPEKRLNGFGQKLVEKAIEWLNKKNCKTIDLTVNIKNKSAISLYKKFGFKNYKDEYITMRKNN